MELAKSTSEGYKILRSVCVCVPMMMVMMMMISISERVQAADRGR